MPEFDLTAIFALPLNHSGVPYMIVGSVAAISYGVHRLTNDLDAVAQMSVADARKVHDAFPENEEVRVAPPELVILRKLEFYREGQQKKHIEDVRDLLRFEDLDLRFVEANVERLGLQEQWHVCQPAQ